MRKEGAMFDARMYISPLIDSKGQQAGWMTSMTNITEAKRCLDLIVQHQAPQTAQAQALLKGLSL